MATWESRKVLCEEADIVAIANAVRSKNGTTEKISIGQMPGLIKGEPCTIYFDVNTTSSTKWRYTDENGVRQTLSKSGSFGGTLTVKQGTSLTCFFNSYVSGDTVNINTSTGIDVYTISDIELYDFFVSFGTTNATIHMLITDCCFIPGTQILVSLDGQTKNIESLQKRDEIVAYNIHTGKNYLATVKNLIINRNTTDMAEVTFADGSQLVMNAYHPIYTKNGFHSLTNHNNYDTLIVGDEVKTEKGWTIITNINRYTSEPIVTYNLDVIDKNEIIDDETNDTFYANGIVVHNASCPT